MTKNRSEPRKAGTIGFSSVRAHDIFSNHTVMFAGEGQQLVLGHRGNKPSVWARGALLGAVWLARQPAGCYRMWDVYKASMA